MRIELYNSGDIDKIIFFRPRTVAGKSDFGALGGGVDKKSEPYVLALDDNAMVLTGQQLAKLKPIETKRLISNVAARG